MCGVDSLREKERRLSFFLIECRSFGPPEGVSSVRTSSRPGGGQPTLRWDQTTSPSLRSVEPHEGRTGDRDATENLESVGGRHRCLSLPASRSTRSRSGSARCARFPSKVNDRAGGPSLTLRLLGLLGLTVGLTASQFQQAQSEPASDLWKGTDRQSAGETTEEARRDPRRERTSCRGVWEFGILWSRAEALPRRFFDFRGGRENRSPQGTFRGCVQSQGVGWNDSPSGPRGDP